MAHLYSARRLDDEDEERGSPLSRFLSVGRNESTDDAETVISEVSDLTIEHTLKSLTPKNSLLPPPEDVEEVDEVMQKDLLRPKPLAPNPYYNFVEDSSSESDEEKPRVSARKQAPRTMQDRLALGSVADETEYGSYVEERKAAAPKSPSKKNTRPLHERLALGSVADETEYGSYAGDGVAPPRRKESRGLQSRSFTVNVPNKTRATQDHKVAYQSFKDEDDDVEKTTSSAKIVSVVVASSSRKSPVRTSSLGSSALAVPPSRQPPPPTPFQTSSGGTPRQSSSQKAPLAPVPMPRSNNLRLRGFLIALIVIALAGGIVAVLIIFVFHDGRGSPSGGSGTEAPLPETSSPSPAPVLSTSSPATPRSSPVLAPATSSSTLAPTLVPTLAPTLVPTLAPTLVPSLAPSDSTLVPPTLAPIIPTLSPTTSTPTVDPVAQRITTLLLSEAFDGGEALRTSGSPQEEASQWLLNNIQLETYTDYGTMQRYAAAALYYATDGQSWVASDLWLSDEPLCQWNSTVEYELRCAESQFLVALSIPDNGLVGTLPPEVAHMTSLLAIFLNQNEISGTIPKEIFSQLTSLVSVDFWLNSLSGTLPTTIGLSSNLQYLDVDSNSLTGNLPSELGALSSIQTLWLNNNNFTGEIPTELGRLMSLEELYLIDNRLEGAVPSALCALPSLVILEADCDVACSCCTNVCSAPRPEAPIAQPAAIPPISDAPFDGSSPVVPSAAPVVQPTMPPKKVLNSDAPFTISSPASAPFSPSP